MASKTSKAKSGNLKDNRLDIAGLMIELDLGESTIRGHLRRGAPREMVGRKFMFDPAAYRDWMASQNLTGAAHRPSAPTSPELEAAKLRKENALANKYELQVERERAGLILTSDVKQWIGEHVATMRAALAGFAQGMAQALEGLDAGERQDAIDKRIRNTLDELADRIKQSAQAPDCESLNQAKHPARHVAASVK